MISDIASYKPKIILEAGAHIGKDTVELAKLGTVYAFEPVPPVYESLINNCNNSPHQDRIYTFAYALSDIDNQYVDIYQSTDPARASSSLAEPKEHLKRFPHIEFKKDGVAATITIDTFCQRHGIGQVDLIWLDLQGYELRALQGATKTLKTTKLLHCEVYDTEMYKGQPALGDIQELLGQHWQIIAKDQESNVIFRNTLV